MSPIPILSRTRRLLVEKLALVGSIKTLVFDTNLLKLKQSKHVKVGSKQLKLHIGNENNI